MPPRSESTIVLLARKNWLVIRQSRDLDFELYAFGEEGAVFLVKLLVFLALF